jgi:hypothetical protein
MSIAVIVVSHFCISMFLHPLRGFPTLKMFSKAQFQQAMIKLSQNVALLPSAPLLSLTGSWQPLSLAACIYFLTDAFLLLFSVRLTSPRLKNFFRIGPGLSLGMYPMRFRQPIQSSTIG